MKPECEINIRFMALSLDSPNHKTKMKEEENDRDHLPSKDRSEAVRWVLLVTQGFPVQYLFKNNELFGISESY